MRQNLKASRFYWQISLFHQIQNQFDIKKAASCLQNQEVSEFCDDFFLQSTWVFVNKSVCQLSDINTRCNVIRQVFLYSFIFWCLQTTECKQWRLLMSGFLCSQNMKWNELCFCIQVNACCVLILITGEISKLFSF